MLRDAEVVVFNQEKNYMNVLLPRRGDGWRKPTLGTGPDRSHKRTKLIFSFQILPIQHLFKNGLNSKLNHFKKIFGHLPSPLPHHTHTNTSPPCKLTFDKSYFAS